MTRTGLLLAALATAAILVPTGAAPFDLTGTDRVSEEIVLQPAERPNGGYAVLNEDDEIELLLTGENPAIEADGVNSNAVTPIPHVFTMTYTGEQRATVWLTDNTDDVRFYRDEDTTGSLEGRANSVVLGPDQTVTVGLLVDTRGDHDVESAETFTVNAEVAEEEPSGDYSGDIYSGGPDTLTPTPEDTATPADDGREATTPTSEDITAPAADGEAAQTDSDSAPSAPSDDEPSATGTATERLETTASDGDTIEIGGLGPGGLLAIGGGLAVLVSGLAGYRLFA